MSAPNVLEARGLVKAYGGRRVLDGVSIRVEPGAVVGLLGPNGAGKTTCFRLLTGLEPADAGSVALDGETLSGPLDRRARRGLGYLPQGPSVFRGLSARDNLRAVLELQPGGDRRNRDARADALLEQLGLAEVAETRGRDLSGGERRRLEIARCLAARPRVLLWDEPFAGVDPRTVVHLQGIMRGLADEGIGMLLTDHDVRDALGICRRAYILVQGRVLAEGSPAELAADGAVRSRFLGDDFRL